MQSSSSGLKSLIYLPVKQSVYWRNSTCENTTRQMHISWCYAVCHSTNSSSVCAPYLQLWEQGDVCPCLWMTIKRPTEDCCQWAGLQRGKERERVCMCVCVFVWPETRCHSGIFYIMWNDIPILPGPVTSGIMTHTLLHLSAPRQYCHCNWDSRKPACHISKTWKLAQKKERERDDNISILGSNLSS